MTPFEQLVRRIPDDYTVTVWRISANQLRVTVLAKEPDEEGVRSKFAMSGSPREVFDGVTWWVSVRGFTTPNVRTAPIIEEEGWDDGNE